MKKMFCFHHERHHITNKQQKNNPKIYVGVGLCCPSIISLLNVSHFTTLNPHAHCRAVFTGPLQPGSMYIQVSEMGMCLTYKWIHFQWILWCMNLW